MIKPDYELRYVDPFSILIVGQKGDLRRLYCPFYVICKIAVQGIQVEERILVDMVRTIPEYTIGYVIRGRMYPHYQFIIL